MYKVSTVEISGFWQKYRIKGAFDENVNIIIGKNGTGKTTFMNILHAVLAVDVAELFDNDFSKVVLKLVNGLKVKTIKHSEATLADVCDQDVRQSNAMVLTLFLICLATGAFDNTPGDVMYFAHPALPKLNGKNYIRWQLLQIMMNGIWQLNDCLFRLKAILPSGAFLTFLLNCFGTLVVLVDVYIRNGCYDDLYCDVIAGLCPWMIFGDDSASQVSPSALIRSANRYGYKLSGQYSDDVEIVALDKVLFCGRTFKSHSPYGPTMALTTDRIVKSVAFVKKDTWAGEFPAQVYSALVEISRHGELS